MNQLHSASTSSITKLPVADEPAPLSLHLFWWVGVDASIDLPRGFVADVADEPAPLSLRLFCIAGEDLQ